MRKEPPPPPPLASVCPDCKGRTNRWSGAAACATCGGDGVIAPTVTTPSPPSPDLAGFITAWAMVEKYGPSDALVVIGEKEWDDRFWDAVQVFEAELNRLESEGG